MAKQRPTAAPEALQTDRHRQVKRGQAKPANLTVARPTRRERRQVGHFHQGL